jgi:hypothetical protein
MNPQTGYQVRPGSGMYGVYLVKADGQPIPADRQQRVFAHPSFDRAQVVCDALNNALLSRVVRAVNADRRARA